MALAIKHNLLVFDPERDDVRVPEAGLVLPIAEHKTRKRKPTVEQVLAEAGWRFDLPTVCKVNGVYYGRTEWATHKLTANDNVEFVSRPLGGMSGQGGSSAKSIGAIVAMVALTALAPWAMGAIGLTGMAASIGSSLLIAGGAMAISHFLKPKAGGQTAEKDDLYSFGFGGNQARPLQPIPVLYGRQLTFPDFAAPKYSEFDGDNMTEYALLAVTCGKAEIEELRISDTRIWTKAGGYNSSFPGIRIEIVNPGEKVNLFPVNVVTASEVSGIELEQTFSPGFTANAPETQAKELLLDFVFPSGCFWTWKGEVRTQSVGVEVQTRTVNAAGAPTGAWTTVWTKTYSYAKQSQIRLTERIEVGNGRYEVRVRRTNQPIEDMEQDSRFGGADQIVWSALRAHIDGPNTFPRVTCIAIRAKASEALSGVMNGQVGVLAARKIPVWTGSGFEEQPSRSIAWAALDIWRNSDYGAGLSLDQIDFQSFYAYDQLWASLGHTFDHVFKEPQTLDDALETILKAGRAMPAPVGDRLTIVRDEPRGIPRMMFTDYDIVKDSLTIDYTLADDDIADGIVGEYIDQTTYRPAEVSSAPDGVTLAKPARVQLPGVTKRSQAAGLVRFMAGENAKRRIMVSWTVRAEGRLLKRGDLVVLSCEEPETWGQSAELVSYNATTRAITFDHDLEWEATGNHYVEIRRRDGQPWGPVRVTRGTSDRIAIVNATDLASETTRQGMSLADAVARSDLADRPTVAFSPGEPRTFRVLITEGTPDTDGEHITLSGVVDDPTVYSVVETGVEPLPTIPDVFSQSIPVVTTLAAQVYQRGMNLVLQAGWQPAKGALTYIADVSYDDGQTWVRAYSGDKTTFEAIVAGAQTIRLRVAGVTAANVIGAFSVVIVSPPPLVLDNSFFIMKIQPDDLIPELSRDLESLGLLDQIADLTGEARVVAEEADERGRAAILQVAEVQVTADKALAIFGTDVVAQFDNGSITVGERFTAVADVTGQLIGAWKVTVGSDGYFTGLQLIGANGPGGFQSELKIAVDKLLVGAPGSGFGAEAVFSLSTRNGVGRMVLRGDFIGDGSINAPQINVTNLSAIAADIGTVRSSQSYTSGGFLIDGPNQRFEIWDNS
ncbi:host specificity factor TipJ family phage tail protein [Microvirga sp. BSC39]|uniref:host specificity factor TipJ family phage tail protein n=1 Tax=Microvirga sp. BSC39 TaxID=1549810 RepID=UPI00068C48CC|nr:host specificity factor TipJ family phage tail protein [Microvirga sp. BSC39]